MRGPPTGFPMIGKDGNITPVWRDWLIEVSVAITDLENP